MEVALPVGFNCTSIPSHFVLCKSLYCDYTVFDSYPCSLHFLCVCVALNGWNWSRNRKDHLGKGKIFIFLPCWVLTFLISAGLYSILPTLTALLWAGPNLHPLARSAVISISFFLFLSHSDSLEKQSQERLIWQMLQWLGSFSVGTVSNTQSIIRPPAT